MAVILTRHDKRRLQDLANQLAQLSVGWHIVNDGACFHGQPNEGVISFDLLAGSAELNGKATRMGIALHAAKWLQEEHARWPRLADLEPQTSLAVRYSILNSIPSKFEIGPAGQRRKPLPLSLISQAVVKVSTQDFRGTSTNTQLVYD